MRRTTVCLLALAGGLAAAEAGAQPSPSPAAIPSAGNITIYDEKFFSQYGVVTARDLLERIPGMTAVIGASFATADQAQRRGLRSDTDQILINGKRSTSKESDVSDYLSRIPANQVLRVEVISGNVKEIDASVSGRVVNVVLKSGAGGTGSGAFAMGGFVSPTGATSPSGDVSYNYTNGGFGFTAGFETRSRIQPAQVYDTIRNPAGVQIGRRYENRERNRNEYSVRGRVSYAFDGGTALQLAGYGNRVPYDDADTADIFVIAGGRETYVSAVQDQTNGHEQRYEVSSDVTVPLGESIKVLGLGVYSEGEIKTDSEIFDVIGRSPVQFAGDARDEVKTQKIARLTIQAELTPKQQLEFGAEGAKTQLDKDLDFFNLIGGTRIDIPVFNSDTVINEDRADVFVSYTWKPGSLEIEPGVGAEFSKLRQAGPDANVSRTFSFVKPSLNIWFSPAPSTRWFLSAQRDVGQLTFEDFAASFIREDNEVVAGNPNLVPEKTWAFELGTEHRLPRDAGVLNARGFYKRISDVNDEVPIGIGASGPGNLGRGTAYGAQLEWSFKLARMNLFDATTGGSLLVQDSSVGDAFTGSKRRIGRLPEYEFKIDYKHDITAWGFSYGFEINKSGASVESDFGRFDRRVVKRGDIRVNYEKRLGWGLIWRMFAGNAAQQFTLRDRTVFAVSQSDGVVRQTERRIERTKFFIGFRLRGNY